MQDKRVERIEVAALRGLDEGRFVHELMLYSILTDCKPTIKSISMTTNSNLIKLYDSTGREIFIPREEYRRKVLPKKFQDVQNDADQLYTTIVISLQDEFFAECISPAKHLLQIDPDRERATVCLPLPKCGTATLMMHMTC